MSATLPPVEVFFSVGGLATVQEAFRSVDQAALRLERNMENASRGGASRRVATARQEARDRGKVAGDWSLANERAEERATRAATKAAAAKGREADRAAQVQAKAAERTAAAEERAARKAADAQIREQQRVERQRRSHEERMNRALGRLVLPGQAGRFARAAGVGPGAPEGGANLGMLAAGGAIIAFKAALDVAAGALKAFGGFLLNDVIKPQLELGTLAQQLANRGGGEVSSKEVLDKINALGVANNVDPTKAGEAVAGISDKVKDVSEALSLADTALKLSKAYGVSAEQAGSFVAGERQQLQGLDAKTFQGLMVAMAESATSKGSGLTISALMSGQATSSAEMLAGDKAAARLATVGLVGIGAKNGSPEQAASDLHALLEDMQKHDKANSTIDGLVKSPDAAIASLIARAGGKEGKLSEMGFSEGARHFLEPMLAKFNEAEAAKKGSGQEAVQAFLAQATSPKAGANLNDLAGEAAKVIETPGERLKGVLLRVTDAFLPLMPVVEKVIAKIAEMEPAIQDLIKGQIVPAMESMAEWLPLFDSLGTAMKALMVVFDALRGVGAMLLAPFSLLAIGILKVLEIIPHTGVKEGSAALLYKKILADPVMASSKDILQMMDMGDAATMKKTGDGGDGYLAKMAAARAAAATDAYTPGLTPDGKPVKPMTVTAEVLGDKSASAATPAAAGTSEVVAALKENTAAIKQAAGALPRTTPMSDPFRMNP